MTIDEALEAAVAARDGYLTPVPTTAKLAENTRRKAADRPAHAARAEHGAARLVEELPSRLPYLTPADIAAVLLHASMLAGTSVLVALEAEGELANRFTLLGPNILAVAGERLYTTAQRSETADGGEPA